MPCRYFSLVEINPSSSTIAIRETTGAEHDSSDCVCTLWQQTVNTSAFYFFQILFEVDTYATILVTSTLRLVRRLLSISCWAAFEWEKD